MADDSDAAQKDERADASAGDPSERAEESPGAPSERAAPDANARDAERRSSTVRRRREGAASASDAARRVLDRALVPASIFVIVACALVVTTFDYGRDQAIYAVVAREILAGRMPYRDAFDFKPPGIFLIYTVARAVFGPTMHGVRILEALSMLATAAGLVRLARVHFGDRKIGFFAAALASQVHAQLDFWHTGQPETFGGMLTVLGLVTATGALGIGTRAPPGAARRIGLWIATGALFGLAGLMKPPLAGGGAIIAAAGALHAFATERSAARAKSGDGKRWIVRAAEPLAAVAIGGTLPFAIVLGWFQAKGALGDLHQVLFVFTPYYTKISWEGQSVLGMGWYGFEEWLMTYSSALFAGVVLLLIMRPAKGELPAVLTLFAIVFLHIAGVVMQGKFFPYHWGATFQLTALLAALGWVRFARWAASKGPAALGAVIVLFPLVAIIHAPVPNMGPNFVARALERFDLYVRGPLDPAKRDGLASVAGVSMGENRAVAEYVKAHTQPNDPIFVWGFECVIYDLAERPLASRYIYDVPQRAVWSRAEMQKALMPELEKSKPAMIVVEHGDVFAFVTGDSRDSAQSLWDFPELRRMLSDDYALAANVGDFDVYERVPAGAKPAPVLDDGSSEGDE